MTDEHNDPITHVDYILDCLRIGVSHNVSKDLLFDARISLSDQADFLSRTLAIQLERTVLADKVLVDKQRVPFRQNVPVSVDVTRWGLKWWCIPVRKVHTSTQRVYVWGTVVVQCDYFRTFPLAKVPYPKEFSHFYKWQELSVADVEKIGQRDSE